MVSIQIILGSLKYLKMKINKVKKHFSHRCGGAGKAVIVSVDNYFTINILVEIEI